MSNETNIITNVKEFIIGNFLFGDDSMLPEDSSFLEAGIIDSTGILELVTFLEEKFFIKIEDDELIPENLDSLTNIETFLIMKINK